MNRGSWQALGIFLLVISGVALLDPACRGQCRASALRLLQAGSRLV